MSHKIKWFDLERFGAALRVIPDSPLRGIQVACLEVRDIGLFQEMFGWPENGEIAKEERKTSLADFRKAMDVLGFAASSAQHISVPDSKNEESKTYLRFFSTKTEFSLSELRGICPDLNGADLRDMSVDQIRLIPDTEVLRGDWASFTESVLFSENINLWTPIANPFDIGYKDSRPISELLVGSNGKFDLIGSNDVSNYQGIGHKLDRANYRQNALIPFYSDIETAISDGWHHEDLEKADLPYALPLWVTKDGQIIALKDIRFAPELMDVAPEQYYPSARGGLIVSAIREASNVEPVISSALDKWREWYQSPEKLCTPNLLWESINSVVSTIDDLRKRNPRFRHDLSDFAEINSDGDGVQAKPLSELHESDIPLIVSVASNFVSMESSEVEEVGQCLSASLRRGQDLLGLNEKKAIKEKNNASVAFVNDDVSNGSDRKPKHVDTGEKIGGARKDYARRCLTIDDLDLMNNMERKAYTLKKNVWPALNYKELRDDGVTPHAAIAIKLLKDSINVKPDRRHKKTDHDPDGEFITAVAEARDAMSAVKTLDDFKEACHLLYKKGRGNTDYISGGTPFQASIGKKASYLLYDSDRTFGQVSEAVVPVKVNLEIRKRGRKAAGWGQVATDDQLWGTLIKPKRVMSEEEKESAKEKADLERELHRPHLAFVERYGTNWRGDRDILADDLIERFGFRGIEFGNWLPQDERQQVLNMAYDSLNDLADVLDIPAKGLSFDGRLAIAFGSRGRGGVNSFLAHFEPALNVINLTRMSGAGALAHEWMHALDFNLGNSSGYLSEQHAASTMIDLVDTMKKRPSSAEEIHSRTSANAQRGADNAVSWLHGQSLENREELKRILEDLYQKTSEAFIYRAKERIAAVKGDSKMSETGFSQLGAIDSTELSAAKISILFALRDASENKRAFTKVKDKIEGNISFMINNMSQACTVEAARLLNADLPLSFRNGRQAMDTDFYKEAKRLDEERSVAYWSTTRELFARAGAAYVFDKLESKGVQSDYLVFGADENRYSDCKRGNPNPTSRDRALLIQKFDKLITEYRADCVNSSNFDGGMEPS